MIGIDAGHTEGITMKQLRTIFAKRSAVGSRSAKQQRCDLLKKRHHKYFNNLQGSTVSFLSQYINVISLAIHQSASVEN